MKPLLLLTLLTSIFLSCSSEEPRQVDSTVTPVAPSISSCSYNLLDGECTYYSDKSVLCSMGSCTSGDCTTGKGVLTYPSGTIIETNFKKGKIEGSLSLKECGNGLQFLGILKDYTRKGKHTYQNGETYEGTIIDDKKEGKGIFVDKAGNIYEGSWKNDIRDGKFTIKDFESKSKRTVTYVNGKDDDERERERQYAIDRKRKEDEQKRKEEAEIADMRKNASINLRWHNKFLACNVFSVHDQCDANVPIIYKSNSVFESGTTNLCRRPLKYEKIYFQCQLKGYQRRALHDTAITIYYDEDGNCSPLINDLCD